MTIHLLMTTVDCSVIKDRWRCYMRWPERSIEQHKVAIAQLAILPHLHHQGHTQEASLWTSAQCSTPSYDKSSTPNSPSQSQSSWQNGGGRWGSRKSHPPPDRCSPASHRDVWSPPSCSPPALLGAVMSLNAEGRLNSWPTGAVGSTRSWTQ